MNFNIYHKRWKNDTIATIGAVELKIRLGKNKISSNQQSHWAAHSTLHSILRDNLKTAYDKDNIDAYLMRRRAVEYYKGEDDFYLDSFLRVMQKLFLFA